VRVRRPGLLFSVPIGLVLFLGGSHAAPGQQKTAAAPEPSYGESSPTAFRRPGVDTDVSLYINHWRNSTPREEHGGFIERDILTRGDPQHPPAKGAVLKYISSYRYGTLRPGAATVPFRRDDAQVFFYVTAGQGRVEAGRKRADLEEGSAVFVPAACEFRWTNSHDAPLELVVVEEETGPGFRPTREISVGSYHDSKPIVGAHWAHIAHPFVYDLEPKFFNPMGFIVVSIDDFDAAQPHTHPPGAEEVWLQLKGRSLLFFGNRLLWQEPGEAFLVPPNSRAPHASINPGGGPQLWLFMGCRHPEKKN
jgi:mannose-6-phosphate isomerase-like protein (cupin superfamily)